VSGAEELELSREQLLALVMAQAQTIARLEAEVTELRRRLGLNSGNSSMPPSMDDQPGRQLPPDKPVRPAKRGRGKQPGAAGMNLAWSDNPDARRDHFPTGACECGTGLAAATDLGVALSHQEHDIPTVTATVTQHDRHRVRCGCGAEHVAPLPLGVADAPVSYGVNLQALCVFLLVVHAVPVQRCAQLVAAITGAVPSVGFVHSLLRRTYAALYEVDKRIRALISMAYVVHFDETPLRVGPKRVKKHLLVACTTAYTYYLIGDRSLATFKLFLLPELVGVIVHDRYVNYDSAEFTKLRKDAGLPALVHQLCTSHILRDLQAMYEAYPDQPWPTQIANALRGLIHAANTARNAGAEAIDAKVKAKLLRLFRDGVLVGLKDIPRDYDNAKQPEYRLLLEVLRDREADVLRFVDDLRIPPTNNQAERDLRPAKTQQKISGRLQSETVTSYRYRIASYLSTARKHSINTMNALRDALRGQPWIPALPTT
jgi:transposase